MNSTGHFEEDDLALYAMYLLAEPEASAVALAKIGKQAGVQ
jgi:hypothetical protein